MSDKQRYVTERIFTEGRTRCVVLMTGSGNRCGYVGVDSTHPLFGMNYSDSIQLDDENYKKWQESDVDFENIGFINALCADQKKLSEQRVGLCLILSAHGGITYSNGGEKSSYPINSDLWWFGFDCAHYNDGKDYNFLKVFNKPSYELELKFGLRDELPVRSIKYCVNECKNLSNQLLKFWEKTR